MHPSKRMIIPIILIPVLILSVIWYSKQTTDKGSDGPIHASGTVEAVEILVASELSGRVLEVFVEKGDYVKAGEPLFRLDGDLLSAQRVRAERAIELAWANSSTAITGVEIAEAGLKMAQAGLQAARFARESAQVQYDITLTNARMAEDPIRRASWQAIIPGEFNQPVWYFDNNERISAAAAEANDSRMAWEAAHIEFQNTIREGGFTEFQTVENQLAQARLSFTLAEDILARANAQTDVAIQVAAQETYEAALSELEAAQEASQSLYSAENGSILLDLKARQAVAFERYQVALVALAQLQVGEVSLHVTAMELMRNQASAAVAQAEAAVLQAEAGVRQSETKRVQSEAAASQAQAELDLIDLQLKKLTVSAPVSGLVNARYIQPGVVVMPGGAAVSISQIDSLTITVYAPEDQYGRIDLGSTASVSVDSFPGETFQAVVVRIAGRAEFTPRNVQTQEGRRTTVFAVELSVEDEAGKLKPGMPADVVFRSTPGK
jgi:HlyD family secretion protein